MFEQINLNNKANFIINSFSNLNSQRIISLALPFLALHTKTASLSSAGIGCYQLYTLWNAPAEKTTTGNKWTEAALLAATAGFGYKFPLAQLVLSNGMFFATELKQLWNPEKGRAIVVLKITDQMIQCLSLYYQTPAWVAASLLSQATSESIQAVKNYESDKKPELAAALLLAACRVYKATTYFPVKEVSRDQEPAASEEEAWTSPSDQSVTETKQEEPVLPATIETAPEQVVTEPKQEEPVLPTVRERAPEHTEPKQEEAVVPATIETVPSVPENSDNGELSRLIEQKQAKIIGADGQEFDFGANFHGFGKYLVKGANLQFRKVTTENGSKGIELSFKVNHLYTERFQKILEGIQNLNPQEQADFAHHYQASGMIFEADASYVLGKKTFKAKTADRITFEGVGSLMVGKENNYHLREQIKVTLNEGTSLESFERFLSMFGLQDAVQKSTSDDLERIKIGILFRTFFPLKAQILERDADFFMLPLTELREKIIDQAPKMKGFFKKHKVEAFEIFPGYFRYGVPIADKVNQLGGHALTTALTSIQTNTTLTPKDLKQLENIMKVGILSQEQREKNGLKTNGWNDDGDYAVGGAQSVYMQMITSVDLAKQRKVGSMGYNSSVKIYASLKVLDRGSYQYLEDSCGTREGLKYLQRPTILEFMGMHPEKKTSHEIMISERVFPEEIKAMSVKSQAIKDQIIAHFKKCGLIQMNEQKIETINNIPVNDFIRTEHSITTELVKNC